MVWEMRLPLIVVWGTKEGNALRFDGDEDGNDKDILLGRYLLLSVEGIENSCQKNLQLCIINV